MQANKSLVTMPQMAHVATGELIVFLSRKLVGRLRVWTHTAQGPEEMCLSLEYQNPSKTSEKWVILIALQFRYTFYRPQTKRLRARKIGLQYKIRKVLSFTRHFVPRSPFGRRAVRQRGYGLRLLIFKSRSGSDKKRRNRLQ